MIHQKMDRLLHGMAPLEKPRLPLMWRIPTFISVPGEVGQHAEEKQT